MGGTGRYSLHEMCLLLGRQSSLTISCRETARCLDAAVIIGIRPMLYESTTKAYGLCNFQRLPLQKHQQHASQL